MTDRTQGSWSGSTDSGYPRNAGLQRLIVGGLLAACIGAGVGIDRLVLESPAVGAQDEFTLSSVDGYRVLEETYDVIRESYVRSGEISDEELMYGAASGMVNALGDTGHSRFLTPEDAQRFMDNTSGELVGIGVNIDSSELPLRVIMPIQNSPALEAGIEAGDLITGINGTPLGDVDNVEAALMMLRGEEGTTVTLTIEREGQAGFDVEITRSRITIEPVSWAIMPGDVLWVRIDQFSAGTTEALAEALQQGRDRGARGLLLDLRANPGGLVSEARGVAQQLQPGGNVLYREENAVGAIEDVLVPEGEGLWQDSPIVVLIDGDSASAAEITASSLADNGRATLVGETTRGTGTVLLPVELSDGSYVLIGTELWLTAKGEVIWHQGVDPSIEVEIGDAQMAELPYTFTDRQMSEASLAASGDTQLVAAHTELVSILQP
jgi:carboxyl-terminal processing protease